MRALLPHANLRVAHLLLKLHILLGKGLNFALGSSTCRLMQTKLLLSRNGSLALKQI
jgi:hypothetical protein